jgi:hypothetical protein
MTSPRSLAQARELISLSDAAYMLIATAAERLTSLGGSVNYKSNSPGPSTRRGGWR